MKKIRELYKRWRRGEKLTWQGEIDIPLPVVFVGGALILWLIVKGCFNG